MMLTKNKLKIIFFTSIIFIAIFAPFIQIFTIFQILEPKQIADFYVFEENMSFFVIKYLFPISNFTYLFTLAFFSCIDNEETYFSFLFLPFSSIFVAHCSVQAIQQQAGLRKTCLQLLKFENRLEYYLLGKAYG